MINANDPAMPIEGPITTVIDMTESYSTYRRRWKDRGEGDISLVNTCCSQGLEFIHWQLLPDPSGETVGQGAKSWECSKE